MDSAWQLPHAPLAPSADLRSPSSLQSLQFTSSSSSAASASSSAPPPYITHLLSLSPQLLLALTSDGNVQTIDKPTMRLVPGMSYSSPLGKGSLTAMAAAAATPQTSGAGCVWGVTDRSGKCSVFDSRGGTQQQQSGPASFGLSPAMTIDTPTASPLLSLAFSSDSPAPLLALGHELHSVDAPVYVYDLRQPAAPLLTYDQSHSDDVTFLSFHHGAASSNPAPVLLSGSTDGLMTVYDTGVGSDEDDAVLSAVNTGASLARGGWTGVASAPGGPAAANSNAGGMDLDGGSGSGSGADADAGPSGSRGLLGSLWAVSDMQTVSLWDADSTDALLQPLSALPASTLLPRTSAWQSRKWETDYLIDAAPCLSTAATQPSLVLWAGDQAGSFARLRVPFPAGPPPPQQQPAPPPETWTLERFFPSLAESPRGGHDDIVRCIVADGHGGDANADVDADALLWTGGEDGKVVLWDLGGAHTRRQDATPGIAVRPVPVESVQFGGGGGGAGSGSGSGSGSGTANASGLGGGGGRARRYKPYG